MEPIFDLSEHEFVELLRHEFEDVRVEASFCNACARPQSQCPFEAAADDDDVDYAPKPAETDGEATNPGPRLRKRGPRSFAARQVRRERRTTRTALAEPGEAHREPDEHDDAFHDERFLILHVNLRGWASHSAELAARVRWMDPKPDLICVNETVLDKARKRSKVTL